MLRALEVGGGVGGWLFALLGTCLWLSWGMGRSPPAIPAQGSDGPDQSSFLSVCNLRL